MRRCKGPASDAARAADDGAGTIDDEHIEANGLTQPLKRHLASFSGDDVTKRYALFEGQLLHLPGFLVHFVVITVMALIAYRITQVRKMIVQYPWRYERASLFAYREKAGVA